MIKEQFENIDVVDLVIRIDLVIDVVDYRCLDLVIRIDLVIDVVDCRCLRKHLN